MIHVPNRASVYRHNEGDFGASYVKPGSHMPQTYDEMAAGPAWDTYCSNKRTELTGNITVIQVFTAGYKVDSGRLMYKKF